ncbi:hypothetical protein HRI_005272700 [Hibiscus trionum]|uniref:Uncharacterized protein n=1 Tax=Hibiscus trionum TaxID=183268 RepID=A0A9W7JL30_HIBTR|nr:hypothetical protein HRI_005272700 [Hibiscus trionum]
MAVKAECGKRFCKPSAVVVLLPIYFFCGYENEMTPSTLVITTLHIIYGTLSSPTLHKGTVQRVNRVMRGAGSISSPPL